MLSGVVRCFVSEASEDNCVINTANYPFKVMIFDAITPTRKSKLIFINGNVNASQYQDILRKAQISEFLKRGAWGSFAFMEDGTPTHRVNTTKNCTVGDL